MAVTISDVAREAGVSTSTVSKVLNHWSSISPETTAKVHKAIQTLHYVPNARAVSFARGSTNNILFLSTLAREEAYRNPHMFDILCGVQKELSFHGYTVTLTDIPQDMVPEVFLSGLISQKSADGVILHGSAYVPAMSRILSESQFPYILIGHPGPRSHLCWTDINNGLAGECAAHHILECGYMPAAYIGGHKTDHISVQRLNGFIGALYDYGYRLADHYIGYTDSSVSQSHAAMQAMLSLPEPPRAIVCGNNTIAIGAMQAIHEAGLNLPDEIAFLTFDRYPYSSIITPAPTVIDIDVYDLGVQAGRMLLRKIENPALLVQQFTTLPLLRQGLTTQLPSML